MCAVTCITSLSFNNITIANLIAQKSDSDTEIVQLTTYAICDCMHCMRPFCVHTPHVVSVVFVCDHSWECMKIRVAVVASGKYGVFSDLLKVTNRWNLNNAC